MKRSAACIVAIALAVGAPPPGVALARPEGSTPPAAPSEASAQALLQAGDAAGAAKAAREITARAPDNARAWLLLGTALQRAGDRDGALAAYVKAAGFDQTAPQGMYNAGCIHAIEGRKDEAFSWLARARATNRIDMTQIAFDPDLESLKGDARFASLLPDPASFKDPFVEKARIIHEWAGEAAGDQFGWIARNIGDVDGDGVNDVVTSAPTREAGGRPAGRIYAYSGRNGRLIWTRTGEPDDRLGIGIEAAGDTNADGVPDVVAGAPGAGKAFVYSGDDGRTLLEIRAAQKDEDFGRHVSDVGDLDGDGRADVLIGAPGSDAAGKDAGRAAVHSGRDGSILMDLPGEKEGDAFGSTVGGATSGGRTMIVVGAPGAGPGARGRVYVHVGRSTKPAFVIEADGTGAQLGEMFVSVVGDVDADGTPDVYASDWHDTAKGRMTGRIYVVSGEDGSRLLTREGEAAGDGFGIGVADAGDVDKDGHADLIVGAWRHSGAAPSGGKAYLYSGRDGSLVRTLTCKVMGDTFGFDATGMGDVDGDGAVDFLITSAWSAINGARSGRMFIVSGK